MKKHKTFFSVLTILVVILILVLLPKYNSESVSYNQPSYSIRRVPAPTLIPSEEDSLLEVNSQPPSNILIISKADFKEGGYIIIFNKEKEVGRSENLIGLQENLQINLVKETSDGDSLTVVLYDEEDNMVLSENVLIITTAVSPGIILPKDLQ